MFRAGRPRRRLLAVLVLAMLLVAAVVTRVGLLQTVDKADYASYGERQRTRSVAIPAERGTIFDRDGQVLALSVPTATIWADPRLIEDPAAAGLTLGAALAMTPEETTALVARLGNTSEFEYVRRQVDDTAAQAVKALGLKGVYQYAEHKRFYPSEEVGRSVLGSTDPDGNGIAGLELQYDQELKGLPGELIRERDQQGRTIPTGRRQVVPAEPGDDLRLTDPADAAVRGGAVPARPGGRDAGPRWHGAGDGRRRRATCSPWPTSGSTTPAGRSWPAPTWPRSTCTRSGR